MAKKSVGLGLTGLKMDKEMQRFRAEDDLRTLHRAHEIKSDKSRHALAMKYACEQMNAVGKGKKK